MKTLYFDIDGTVLPIDKDEAKTFLRNGALEKSIRRAGFERLVCVGNIGIVANAIVELGVDYDAIEVVFRLCDSAFEDKEWFQDVTRMVDDPENRASLIDYESGWWYVDDLAEHYLEKANRLGVLQDPVCDRVFIPNPKGNGTGIIEWLGKIPV